MEANTHPILGREPSVNELQRQSGAVLTPGFFALPNQLKTGDSTYFPSLMTQISVLETLTSLWSQSGKSQ